MTGSSIQSNTSTAAPVSWRGLQASALVYWAVGALVAGSACRQAITESGWAALYIYFVTVPIFTHVTLSVVTTVGAVSSRRRLRWLGQPIHAVAWPPFFAVGVIYSLTAFHDSPWNR